MRRLYPRGTRPEDVPPDAEGVSLEEWRASVPWRDIDDPIARHDMAKRLAAEAEKAAKKRGAKR